MGNSAEKKIIGKVLDNWPIKKAAHRAWVGFDGYVDRIQHPVQSQDDSGSTFYPTLDSFARRIQDAAGKSAQVELYTQEIKAGGNAPIMAHALACLGIGNTCVGTFGIPEIHPVFRKMHDDCQLVSLNHAAETNALEFNDGKLMLSELSAFTDLDWAAVVSRSDLVELIDYAVSASLIALVDWCNLPHATDIWNGFLREVVKGNIISRPHFFFDLTDPSKKTDAQISEVISLINQFAHYGEVTLGLNENESIKLAGALSREKSDAPAALADLSAVGQYIFEEMSIHRIIIHPLDSCYVINSRGSCHLRGKLVKEPLVATGGGDNFNAGFYYGILNGFSPEESMILAMATSGAYVQHGSSPDRNQLRSYLEHWQQEI